MQAESTGAAVEPRPAITSADVDDSPAAEDGPDRYPEPDDLVPFFDGDDWPAQFGAARLGIP
jgi:hypothetical protein